MPKSDPVETLLSGKYRVLDRLGGGGMGDVYRGENTVTGRPVALKILRADLTQDPMTVARFFQEAQAVNQIRHPNIVDVLDLDVSDGVPFIAMQCLSGESTRTAATRLGKLSIAATVAIGADVLDALHACHRAGIVHRNLKPENVFLHRTTPDVPVSVKVLDFGIARLLPVTAAGRAGALAMAMDHLSPEQVLGEPVIDGRSDLFAVASLLFELLTGHPPLRAPTAIATAHRVVSGAPSTFSELGRMAHPMLESILVKALSKRPVDRYATAADFARELLHVAPDAVTRAQALQDVLGDPSSPSGTLPTAPIDPSPSRRPSAPPPPSRAHSSPSGLWRAIASSPADAPPGRSSDPTGTRRAPVPPVGARRTSKPPASRDVPASSPPSVPSPAFCHVRGHVLRSTDHYVLAAHGAAVRDRILARLPARYSDDFRHGSLTGVVLYDLGVFEAYAAAANAIALGNEPITWRQIGRGCVEGQLASLMRNLSQGPDEAALLRRCTATWSRLVDFGKWSCERNDDGEIVLRLTELAPASVILRQWLIGVVEQTLRSAGYGGTVVTAPLGDALRMPELDLSIRLRT